MPLSSPLPKVLVIAEEANPEWVSVPLVGWSLAMALRAVADVHIVTQVRNRDAFVRAGLVEGRDFTALDSEAVAAPLHRLATLLRRGQNKGWTIATAINSLAYPYFEHLVWKRFGAAIRAGDYDIVHRVTPLSPTVASIIAPKVARAGVPFVLGPLNGGVPWPKAFDQARRKEREWLSYVRGAYRLNPQYRATMKAARAILTGSRHTQSELPPDAQAKSHWLPENAIDPARFNLTAAPSGVLRGCFIGRLVPYKGADMLIEAAAPLVQAGQMVLDILGEGPMRAALEHQIAALGLTHGVTLHGHIPHAEVQALAAQAHLLTFPSIREFGGGVVLEAMALGVVPMVVDYAGPGELVCDQTGYKIALGTRAQIVAELRAQLTAIVQDPSGLPAKAQAAQKKALGDYTWAAKAQKIRKIYEGLLA